MSGVILGAKLDQSQQFDEQGRRIVVTHITTSPCYIIRVKQGKNNNVILKLGFGLSKSTKKPQLGEMQKAGIKAPLHFLKEMLFPIGDAQIIEEDKKRGIAVGEQKLMEGDELKPNVFFKKDDVVSVIGISKGKGFQGGVKRHGFAGGPKTHGQSDRHRAPGSIGQTTTPGRVLKGKRMAGRMGGDIITTKGLIVVEASETALIVKGLVPGAKRGFLQIRSQQ